MNVTCLEFDTATGKILMMTSMPVDVMEIHEAFLPGATLKWLGYGEPFPDQLTHYVDLASGEVIKRPSLLISVSKLNIAADDQDAAVISLIPEGADVTIDDVAIAMDGDTLTLTAAMPAAYQLVIECWPHLPFKVEIVAQ